MAIHPDLPGITVKIYSSDAPLEEFDEPGSESPATVYDEEEGYRKLSKYIKSETGKEFSIRFAICEPFEFDADILGIIVHIDNEECVRKFVKRDAFLQKGKKYSCTVKGVTNPAGRLMHFQFVDIERSKFFFPNLCRRGTY